MRAWKCHSALRQLEAGDTWDTPEECFYALGLSPEEADAVADHVAGVKLLPRPGDDSDQPALPVDTEGWGYMIPAGSAQPTLF